MLHKKRTYGLGIWWLGLGYYLFYTPYSGLTKALSGGLLTDAGPVPGNVLLPASVLATAFGMLGFITFKGWWKYAGRREFFGLSIPFPRRLTFLSGVCMATIMGTTTLAFAFGGVSIVLVLVLLRGGVLVIAPLVDAISARRVRWFSWAAMSISLLAVAVVLADASNYTLSLAAMLDVSAYLAAYFFKLQFMTKLAKTDERSSTLRYFVEEQMVASPLLLLALGVLAAIGHGEVMSGFRLGFSTSFLGSPAAVLALLVGLCYAGLCVCTTFIFLDCRENTFCVPMHCGSSMLAGLTASYVLAFLYGQSLPSAAQLASSGLIAVALLFLSPLHHGRRYAGKLAHWLADVYRVCLKLLPSYGKHSPAAAAALAQAAPTEETAAAESSFENIRRVYLFVCSGNTCRSPMAAAAGNAEIAARLQLPFENSKWADAQAMSAGVSARVGAPMTPEAHHALSALGISAQPHRARNLTAELAHQVEQIFCMTQAQRKAVIDLIPAAAAKTQCLDPEGDVEDPIGSSLSAYVDCARRIRSLVRLRFDEISLAGGLSSQT
jgi:protein-tyrosine-phosphatase